MSIVKPYETEGAAKYYFDLAGELRVQNGELLKALADIVHRASPTGNNALLKRIVAIAETAIRKVEEAI